MAIKLLITDFDGTPLMFEVFTDSALETEALHTLRNLRVDNMSLVETTVRNIVGRKGIKTIKKIIGR